MNSFVVWQSRGKRQSKPRTHPPQRAHSNNSYRFVTMRVKTLQISWHPDADGKNTPLLSLDMHPTLPLLATAGADSEVKVSWQPRTGAPTAMSSLAAHALVCCPLSLPPSPPPFARSYGRYPQMSSVTVATSVTLWLLYRTTKALSTLHDSPTMVHLSRVLCCRAPTTAVANSSTHTHTHTRWRVYTGDCLATGSDGRAKQRLRLCTHNIHAHRADTSGTIQQTSASLCGDPGLAWHGQT